jgi:hypothetical protein
MAEEFVAIKDNNKSFFTMQWVYKPLSLANSLV